MISISPLFGQLYRQWVRSEKLKGIIGSTHGSCHPKRRPNPTCVTWHVLEIKHNQPVGILLVACDADAVTATTGCHVRRVCFERNDAIPRACQVIAHRRALVNVIDVAMGRVVFLDVA